MSNVDQDADQLLDYCRAKGIEPTHDNLRTAYLALNRSPYEIFVESLEVEYKLLRRLAAERLREVE